MVKIKNLPLFRGESGQLSSWKQLLPIMFISGLVFGIYFHTLQYSFIFDDFNNIVDNKSIHLSSFTPDNVKKVLTEGHLLNRPVSNISFALNYYFHQDQVLGYRIVNVLIHLTNGFLLYFFVKLTLGLPALRSQYSDSSYRWLPLVTALVWVAHPIHTQSVTYIVQRMNSLAAMFYLLSFVFYIKGRTVTGNKLRWSFFVGSMVSAILAFGAKEMVVVLPFFISLYEWYFFRDLNCGGIKRCSLVMGAFIATYLAIIVFLFLGTDPLGKIMVDYKLYDFNLLQRALTEFRVVIFYITLLIFPHPSRLNLDHHFVFSQSLLSPSITIFSLLITVSLILLAVWLARKERLISFCIFWFFCNLLVESSVIPLDLVFEHRTYIPSMLVILLAVIFADRVPSGLMREIGSGKIE